MKLRLEFGRGREGEDQAVLVITEGNGEVTEVRGNGAVGTKWTGDTLDRLIGSLNRMVNVSSLFADDEVHLREDWAKEVRAFLVEEDRLRALMFAGVLKERWNQ